MWAEVYVANFRSEYQPTCVCLQVNQFLASIQSGVSFCQHQHIAYVPDVSVDQLLGYLADGAQVQRCEMVA